MDQVKMSTSDWFNKPDEWRENYQAPADVEWFQRELESIGGKTLNGKPHYRIVWGMDMENAVMRDRYNDRFVPRYLYRTIRWVEQVSPSPNSKLLIPVQKEKFIGTPRFYIESFIPPEVACASGTEAGFDADGDRFSAWMPSDGDWFPMIEICEHDEFGVCCNNAFAEDRNCHGNFRPPSMRDVETVRLLYKQMIERRKHRPDEAVPRSVANDAMAYAIEREKQRRAAIEKELAYNGANFMAAHGFTGAAKYHALPGIAIPGVTQGWGGSEE